MLSNNNLFLNYNGFNNIKKSTSHIIKTKKNDIKLCDIANNCYNLEYNIKGKNIFDLSIELENLENTPATFIYNNSNINSDFETDTDDSDTDDSDTETLVDINIENFNNPNKKLIISKNNLIPNSYIPSNKIDLYQELLNYHMVIIIIIIIMMIYFLRK